MPQVFVSGGTAAQTSGTMSLRFALPVLPSASSAASASTTTPISETHPTACTLAVYASPCRLPARSVRSSKCIGTKRRSSPIYDLPDCPSACSSTSTRLSCEMDCGLTSDHRAFPPALPPSLCNPNEGMPQGATSWARAVVLRSHRALKRLYRLGSQSFAALVSRAENAERNKQQATSNGQLAVGNQRPANCEPSNAYLRGELPLQGRSRGSRPPAAVVSGGNG